MFCTGAAVLVIEIAGTGIISPFFGSTIYVWASLISVTMAALALGYFAGGRICEKKPDEKLFYAIMLAASFSVLFAAYTSPFILKLTDSLGNRMGAFVSAALIFTIPLMLLGMLSPFAVKILDLKTGKAGMSSGLAYGFGTLGSFTGAVAAGFFLIPFLGIRLTLLLTAAVLALLPALWYAFFRGKMGWLALFACAALFTLVPPYEGRANPKEQLVFEKRSLYSKLQVTRYNTGFVGLKSDNVLQTVYDEARGEFNNGYIQQFAEAGRLRKNGTALSIGLGAGAIDNVLKRHGITVTNVEIDPEVEKIAGKYFGFNGKCEIADGRYYLRRSPEKFDLIYIDVFSGFSFGKYLLTKEALTQAKQALKPGGITVINVIGRYAGAGKSVEEQLVKSVYSTLKKVYDNVNAATDGNERVTANYIFFASDSADIPKGNLSAGLSENDEVITDDRNKVEEMSADIIQAWRNEAVKYIGEFSAEI